MWTIIAFLSACFAGITAILAKCGIKDTDSTVATALRTVVVLVFSWVMVWLTCRNISLTTIPSRSIVFLILSGLSTGASWLCYFRALQLGDVNKVAVIDKSSIVLTMLLAILIFKESCPALHIAAMAMIMIGTLFMIQRRSGVENKEKNYQWMIYAILSAVFASLTSILGKVGVTDIDSTLATAIRTIVVLFMAWLMVFVKKKQREVLHIKKRSLLFLVLSGLSTGASWLCYYRALQTGPASVVVPIDKLSIVLTVVFSITILKERLSIRACGGLLLIVAGTLLLLV